MSIDLENSKRKAAKASKFPEDVVEEAKANWAEMR